MNGATAESPRPERLPPRGLGAPGFAANLARRVATALVALPAILAALLLGPPWLALAIVVVALGVGLCGVLRARCARGGSGRCALVGVLLAAALFLDVVAPGWLPVPVRRRSARCCC